MATPFFSDIFKLFHYATKKTALEDLESREPEGVGVTSPEANLNLRNQMYDGGLQLKIGDSNSDFIDMGGIIERKGRYKEYERLEGIPEVHAALNTFADESCLAGHTKISTPFGHFTIQELAESKDPTERFLVYSWDFSKNDYTLGWAYHPRLVKKAPTVKVMFDNGTKHIVTPDHLFLTMDNQWKAAGDLKYGDSLKAFYRLPANQYLTELKTRQFARIFTYEDGWKHERQFIDEWKTNDKLPQYSRLNKVSKFISHGLNMRQIEQVMDVWWKTIENNLQKEGFSYRELVQLNEYNATSRKVVGVCSHDEVDVYDLSVENHENFCTDQTVVHNCQINDQGYVFQVSCPNSEVKKEAEFVVHKLLDLDGRAWGIQRNICKFGDFFGEIVIDPMNPKKGIQKLQVLPVDSMYRIETAKGRLLEFQQSREGPDYNAILKTDITKASESQLAQSTAIRFHPAQIIHERHGDDRKTFYPYGISMLEAARNPAWQLHLMEDAMLVYRLVRAPERRLFYFDVGNMPAHKVNSEIDRMKDLFRKKKTYNNNGAVGASAVNERWHSISPDEDFFIPVRPNSTTRVETLAGAANLGEVDDALYFRQRLFTALQFPKTYLTNEDPQATRLTLSQQDVRFARLIERLQKPLTRAVNELVRRHLKLRGYPEELFKDLMIKMTPPSDWRQINRNEVTEVLYNRAAMLKGSQLMCDYDILTRVLGFEEDKAKEYVERIKAQKFEDLKMQLIASNPDQLGITVMGQGTEVGAAPGGPNPMLGPEENPEGEQPMPSPGSKEAGPGEEEPKPEGRSQQQLPEPEDEDIKKYNLEIDDFASSMDVEEIDPAEISDDML